MAENAPDFPKAAQYVEVTQVVPGFRQRQAIVVIRRTDYPTGRIPLEHVEAFIDRAVSLGGQWRFIEDGEIDEATA